MAVVFNGENVGIVFPTIKYEKPKGEFFVKVIDVDGTLLDEVWLDTGQTYTLPEPRVHEGLVFQEWSCSQEIVDGVVTATDNNIMIGAIYTTESGLNEFVIEITPEIEPNIETNGYTVTLNANNTKWWDYANDKETSDTETSHTYYEYGTYVIATNSSRITSVLMGQSSSAYNKTLKQVRIATISALSRYLSYTENLETITLSNMVTSIVGLPYSRALKCLIIPQGCSITNFTIEDSPYLKYAFLPYGATRLNYRMFVHDVGLKQIVIPNTVTATNSGGLQGCVGLEEIVINNVTTGASNFFAECVNLKNVKLGSWGEYLYGQTFLQCYSLENIELPKEVETTLSYSFQYCYSLKRLSFLGNVATFNGQTAQDCYSLERIEFLNNTQVATASSSVSIQETTKIIVPDELYDEWIVATNWSARASQIYKASEVLS